VSLPPGIAASFVLLVQRSVSSVRNKPQAQGPELQKYDTPASPDSSRAATMAGQVTAEYAVTVGRLTVAARPALTIHATTARGDITARGAPAAPGVISRKADT
jgi:hypothetical protein